MFLPVSVLSIQARHRKACQDQPRPSRAPLGTHRCPGYAAISQYSGNLARPVYVMLTRAVGWRVVAIQAEQPPMCTILSASNKTERRRRSPALPEAPPRETTGTACVVIWTSSAQSTMCLVHSRRSRARAPRPYRPLAMGMARMRRSGGPDPSMETVCSAPESGKESQCALRITPPPLHFPPASLAEESPHAFVADLPLGVLQYKDGPCLLVAQDALNTLNS